VLSDYDGPTKKVYGAAIDRTGGALAVNAVDWTFGINHAGLKFGHGFVVAGLLAGLPPAAYSKLSDAERTEYQQAVQKAITANRPWAHPPFLRTAAAGSEDFLKWVEEVAPLQSKAA